MTDTYRLQTLQILLNQANDACQIERDLLVKAEQRTAQSRVLWFELAQRLVPTDLDDLWKTTDVNLLPDDQFARWLGQQLARDLFDYRALRSGRHTEQLAKWQVRLQERDLLLQQRDEQIAQLTEQVNQIVSLKDRIGEVRSALEQAQQEKDELASDLETSRAQVTRLRAQLAALASPVSVVHPTARVTTIESAADTAPATHSLESDSTLISTTTASVVEPAAPLARSFDLINYPVPSDRTPNWYSEWLATTKPEDRDRQSAALYAIGQGQAFIRAEVLEYLNGVGLMGGVDLDKPSGFAGRILRGVIDQGFVEEVDGGFGAAVPTLLRLCEKGRTAYGMLFGSPLEETLYDRLLKRHKTPEHTVLNVLARRVLLRLGFPQVELFPDPARLASGLLAEPDLVVISPAGEKLYVECERGHLVRTDEERAAKWNRMIELGGGQLYLFVPTKSARGNLLAELSSWITSERASVRRAELFFCEYTKALNSSTAWTHTTNIYQ